MKDRGQTPRVAVIGRGLIGSAAARHLANAGLAPTLIGPGEPADKRTHTGVFASHYDEGRITRKNATHAYWAEASRASIARYGDIAVASGISFFRDVGALMVGADDGAFLSAARQVARDGAIPHGALSHSDLTARFPDLTLPQDHAALYEPRAAGHISPRRLVLAQTKAAERAGARIVDAVVSGLEETKDGITIHTATDHLTFDRVLVAAGGMTDHLLARPRTFHIYGRTVALFRLSEEEARRLSTLPSAVFDTGHYLLPPIRYPDGRCYMKLGGEPRDHTLDGPQEIGDWFRSGGNQDVQDALEGTFRDLFPRVQIEAVTRDACITTWTDDLLPEIRALSPRVAIAAAGNGAGAKCSDELGRRGAALMTEDLSERTLT